MHVFSPELCVCNIRSVLLTLWTSENCSVKLSMTDLWSLAAVTTGLPFMEVSEAWLSSLKHVLCYCVDFSFCCMLILTETWFILLSGSNPCELSCLAIGHNFYYNFGRVLDGTPCQADQGTVCVNGKCLVSSWFLGYSFIMANNHRMMCRFCFKELFLPNLMTLKNDFCGVTLIKRRNKLSFE